MPVVNTGGCSRGRPTNQSHFSESFRKQVFILLHLGYEQLTPDSYSKSEEQDITGDLIGAINEVLEVKRHRNGLTDLMFMMIAPFIPKTEKANADAGLTLNLLNALQEANVPAINLKRSG